MTGNATASADLSAVELGGSRHALAVMRMFPATIQPFSSTGFIELIRDALPPERRHGARYVRLRNAPEHAVIATAGNHFGIVITILFAVVGIAPAGFSGVKLYKAAQGDNAREDTGRSIAGIVIGSAITIVGVIIGVLTTYVTGQG